MNPEAKSQIQSHLRIKSMMDNDVLPDIKICMESGTPLSNVLKEYLNNFGYCVDTNFEAMLNIDYFNVPRNIYLVVIKIYSEQVRAIETIAAENNCEIFLPIYPKITAAKTPVVSLTSPEPSTSLVPSRPRFPTHFPSRQRQLPSINEVIENNNSSRSGMVDIGNLRDLRPDIFSYEKGGFVFNEDFIINYLLTTQAINIM